MATSATAIKALLGGGAGCRDRTADTGLVTIGLQDLFPDAFLPHLIKVGKVSRA